MSTINRREFLRLSAAGFSALVTGQIAAACNQSPAALQPTSTNPPAASPIPTQTPAPAPTNTAAAATDPYRDMNRPFTFPKDFSWGAATSAYQSKPVKE